MPSSNKTANLNLNQWAATDGVCRADFNADNLAIDTAIGAMPIVKLKEVTTTAAAQTVEISLSDINMSQYSEIWMDIQLGVTWNQGGYSYFRVNNISTANYNDTLPMNNTPYMNSGVAYSRLYTGLNKFALGETLCWFKPTFSFYGEIAPAALLPQNWTSITLFVTSGTIPAGGKVRIYGVKKV